MNHLKLLTICLVALALHGRAWAQIYETKDAEGNPVFTDSPATENAEEIDLQQTNIADAPAPNDAPEGAPAPQAAAPAQAPVEENVQNDITVDRGGYDDGQYVEDAAVDGAYVNDVEARERRREDAVRRADPDAPHEVGDSEVQMPREVGDSEVQMPREVGDSPTQMPREVGDAPIRAEHEYRR